MKKFKILVFNIIVLFSVFSITNCGKETNTVTEEEILIDSDSFHDDESTKNQKKCDYDEKELEELLSNCYENSAFDVAITMDKNYIYTDVVIKYTLPDGADISASDQSNWISYIATEFSNEYVNVSFLNNSSEYPR